MKKEDRFEGCTLFTPYSTDREVKCPSASSAKPMINKWLRMMPECHVFARMTHEWWRALLKRSELMKRKQKSDAKPTKPWLLLIHHPSMTIPEKWNWARMQEEARHYSIRIVEIQDRQFKSIDDPDHLSNLPDFSTAFEPHYYEWAKLVDQHKMTTDLAIDSLFASQSPTSPTETKSL